MSTSNGVPNSDQVLMVDLLDERSCNSKDESALLKREKRRRTSQMSAAHWVMVLVLQCEDAFKVEEHRRSLPSSQARIVGFLQ